MSISHWFHAVQSSLAGRPSFYITWIPTTAVQFPPDRFSMENIWSPSFFLSFTFLPGPLTETSPLTLTLLLSSVCGARAGSTGFSSLDTSFFDNCSQELGPRIFIPHVSLFHFLGRSDGRINSLSFPRRLVLVLPSQVWELRPPPCSGHLSWPRPSQTAWPGHASLCYRFPLAGCGNLLGSLLESPEIAMKPSVLVFFWL